MIHPAVRGTRFARLAREATWVATGQALTAIGAIVSVRVLTGLLTPEEYGTLVLALTVGSLTQLVFFAPIVAGPGRFLVPAREKGEFAEFLRGTRALALWGASLFVAVSACATVLIVLTASPHLARIFATAALFALALGLGSLLDALQAAARQRAVVALHSGVGQWLRILGAVIAVSIGGASSDSVLLGFTTALALVLLSQIYFFRRFSKRFSPSSQAVVTTEAAKSWRGRMIRFGWPFAVWGPAYWLQSSADRWVIEGFVGREAVGLYSAAYQVGYQPILLLSNVVLQLMGPISYEWAGEGADAGRVGRAHRLVQVVAFGGVLATAACTALGFAFRDSLFRLIVDPRYAAGSWLTPWLILSAGLFACGQAASLYHLTAGNPRALLLPKIITAILGAGLNLVGAIFFGLKGVAFASVAFSAMYCAWMLLDSKSYRTALVPLETPPIPSVLG